MSFMRKCRWRDPILSLIWTRRHPATPCRWCQSRTAPNLPWVGHFQTRMRSGPRSTAICPTILTGCGYYRSSCCIGTTLAPILSLFRCLIWQKRDSTSLYCRYCCCGHCGRPLTGCSSLWLRYSSLNINFDQSLLLSSQVSWSFPRSFVKYLAFHSHIRTRPRKCVANSFTKVCCSLTCVTCLVTTWQ